jgi:YggT family protein
MCAVWSVVQTFFYVYLTLLFVYALLSWVPSLRGRWSDYLAMLIEPVLAPVRRVIPPLGGLDLSFMVVSFLILIVLSQIVAPQVYVCRGL